MPLWHQLQIKQSGVTRGGIDRAFQIELIGCALAREFAQLAQRQLEVARAELDRVIEVAVLAPLPHLDGAPLAGALPGRCGCLRGLIAVRAEGRGAAGADPLVAALMALALARAAARAASRAACPSHRGLRCAACSSSRERARGERAAATRRAPRPAAAANDLLRARENLRKDPIEAVVVALVLHEAGAREIVEVLRRDLRHARPQRLEQVEELGDGDRDTRAAQLEEELHQHGGGALQRARRCMNTSCSNRCTSCSFFEQRAVQDRNHLLARSVLRSASGAMSSATSSLIQSSSSEVEGFFFRSRCGAHLEERPRAPPPAAPASGSGSAPRRWRASSPRPGSGCSGRSSGAGRRPAAPSRCCW